MKNKIIFSLVLLVLIAATFVGCKKNKNELLGPQYSAAPADFAVVGNQMVAYDIVKASGFFPGIPVTSTININTRYLFFKSAFSHKVGWKLTIRSWKSGAVKEIVGFSDFLDSTNTKWDGGSSNDYFFGYSDRFDSVQVKLSFANSSLSIIDTFRVNKSKNYHLEKFNGVFHYLVDDFELTNPVTAFSSFYPDQLDLGGGNAGNNANGDIKCQGNFSYSMYGKDLNNNTYLGSCNTPTLNDIPPNTFKGTDPDNLYINLYVYGTGKSNTTVSVIAFENDANQAQGTAFNQMINDKLIYQIAVDWTGWKLVSFRYSLFKKPNTGGGLGNNRLNPEKLTGLALELDSYPSPGFEVEAYVDMVVITENGTFQK